MTQPRRILWFVVFAAAVLLLPSRATAQNFVATGSMTTVRYEHTATLLSNGKALIAGGNAPLDHRHYRLLLLCNDERPEFRLELHRRGDRALGRFCEHATSVARIHVGREGSDDRELCSEPVSESNDSFT